MKKSGYYLFALIFIVVAFVSVSFASFNTNLFVSGAGVLRAQAEIRVNGIVNSAYHGEAVENFNPNFDVNETNVSVDLPTSNSSVEYTVTIKNYGDRAFLPEINLLSQVSNNVVITISDGTTTYNLPDDDMNFEFAANEEKTFTITISNKPGTTNEDVLVSLQYDFVHDEVTAPIIARSGNNVVVSVAGTSTFAVDHYEYYYNTTGATPNDNTTATGNTSGTLSIDAINEGHYYIWYRTVSTKNTKSSWSNGTNSTALEIIKSFTLTYNVNNSDAEACDPGTVTKSYGSTWGTLCSPSATGFTFTGWNTQANGSGDTITASSEVEEDITVYGQWTTNQYTITLNGNGGTISALTGWTRTDSNTKATKQVYYRSIVGTLPEVTRTGYTFVEWNTNQNGTGTEIESTTTMGTSGITGYAIWHDSTKPVCEFGATPSLTYGSTATVVLTCTDNDSMTSQTLNASNFTASNSSIVTISNVSSPTVVSGGYKYTVTLNGTGVGSYTVSLNANSI